MPEMWPRYHVDRHLEHCRPRVCAPPMLPCAGVAHTHRFPRALLPLTRQRQRRMCDERAVQIAPRAGARSRGDRARSGRRARLRGIQTRSRAQFDAKDLACTQHFATSKDGTKVPYFQLGPKEMKLDGSHPTLLDGYGGFEISLEPGASSFNHNHVAIARNRVVVTQQPYGN